MLESRAIYDGISYKAKRDYIYRYDRDDGTVTKYRLTDDQKKRIKTFAPDYYDGLSEYKLLNDIWSQHADKALWDYWNNKPQKSCISEYYK